MPAVRLVATQILRYAGRLLTPGEVFTARSRDDARALKALRRAVDEPVRKPRAKAAVPAPPAPPVPEPVAEPVQESEPVVEDPLDYESADSE